MDRDNDTPGAQKDPDRDPEKATDETEAAGQTEAAGRRHRSPRRRFELKPEHMIVIAPPGE